jgi:hypothetical protein
MVWGPRTSVALSLICHRVWDVPCGIRNDAPSCRLGNVNCGATATGAVSLRNVLTLTLRELTIVADGVKVHEPSTL